MLVSDVLVIENDTLLCKLRFGKGVRVEKLGDSWGLLELPGTSGTIRLTCQYATHTQP